MNTPSETQLKSEPPTDTQTTPTLAIAPAIPPAIPPAILPDGPVSRGLLLLLRQAPPFSFPTFPNVFHRIMSTGAEKVFDGVPFKLGTHTPEDLTSVLKTPFVSNWFYKAKEEYHVKGGILHGVTKLPNGNVLFAFITLDASDRKTGKWVPGACFLRPDSAAVLVELNGHLIFVEQARVGAARGGSDEPGDVTLSSIATPEIVAGSQDGEGNLVGLAAKEVKEETGLSMAGKLRYLGSAFPSVGGCCEKMHFYHCRLPDMPAAEFEAMKKKLEGKVAGVAAEGEATIVRVLPMGPECDRVLGQDMKYLSAMYLLSKQ